MHQAPKIRPAKAVSFVFNSFPVPRTHGHMLFWLAVALQERTSYDELDKMHKQLFKKYLGNIAKCRALSGAICNAYNNLNGHIESLVENGGLLYFHDGLRAKHLKALGLEVEA